VIQLYEAGGAGDFTILQDALTHDQCRLLFENAGRLLAARAERRAAELLRTVPFRIADATNHFNDEFSMLHAVVPLKQYEELRRGQHHPVDRQAFRQIAEVLSELGTPIRFVAIELALEAPMHPATRAGGALKQSEISKVVSKYIGVSGGYLGDFLYRSHHEFYLELDLDNDPYKYDGTTRERFIKILSESSPAVQAKILEGVLTRFPGWQLGPSHSGHGCGDPALDCAAMVGSSSRAADLTHHQRGGGAGPAGCPRATPCHRGYEWRGQATHGASRLSP
jgi:hypothetical protein